MAFDARVGCMQFALCARLTRRDARKQTVRALVLPNGSSYVGPVVVHDGCQTPHGDGIVKNSKGVTIHARFVNGVATYARVKSDNSCSLVQMDGWTTDGMALSVWTRQHDGSVTPATAMPDCNTWWGMYGKNLRNGYGMLISYQHSDVLDRVVQMGVWDNGVMRHGQRCHSSGMTVVVNNKTDVVRRPMPLQSSEVRAWHTMFCRINVPCQMTPLNLGPDVAPDMLLLLGLQPFAELVTNIASYDVNNWSDTVHCMPGARVPTFIFCYPHDIHASAIPSVTPDDVETIRKHASTICNTVAGYTHFQVLMVFGPVTACHKMVLYAPADAHASDPALAQLHECSCGVLAWTPRCSCGAHTSSTTQRLVAAGFVSNAMSLDFFT